MVLLSTSRTTGTIRPRSVSTATPMCTYFLSTIDWLAMSTELLNCGNLLSAAAMTLSAIAVMVSLPPAFSAVFAYFCRSFSSSVMSDLSHCVTCGMVAHAADSRSAVMRRMLRIGCTSTSPH